MVSVLPPLHLQDDALIAILDQQAGNGPAVDVDHGVQLITAADHQAWVEDVGEQLIERAAAVARQIGADLVPFAVDLVALCAELFEHLLAAERVAGRAPRIAHANLRSPARAGDSARCGPCPTCFGQASQALCPGCACRRATWFALSTVVAALPRPIAVQE